jgi:tetratricopeptide (TPR) repeat protein
LDAVKNFLHDGSLKSMLIWDMNTAHDLVSIAALILEGEIYANKKQIEEAAILFRKAIAIEDNLSYTEPPDWFFSTRLTLGHWLIEARDYASAETVYREDLETFRENGWALIGLYNSLKGQQKNKEAEQVKRRFEKAWSHADISITSSRKF